MKILVVNNMAPFIWGGAEALAEQLCAELEKIGHKAETLRIPFQWEPYSVIPSQMLMVKALELWDVDKVIALKFPAYYIEHPNKTIWLLHQYRQAYDLYDEGQSNLPDSPEGQAVKQLIHNADKACFTECNSLFTNSPTTQRRLKHYNNMHAPVLYPPLNDPERFTGGEAEGYLFAGGRINSMKRQHLLLEAYAHSDKSVKLLIAGPPDSPEDAQRLEALVEERGLQDKVKLDLRFLTREELASYVNHATACAYLPFDEDSLGYVTMEAFNAAKPVISTTDSGGVRELVLHGKTGWVCEPEKNALAAAISEAGRSARKAEQLGKNARKLWQDMDITWANTLEKLLQ